MINNDITVSVSYDVVHYFEDAAGNTYVTDQWEEEAIDLEVSSTDVAEIIEAIKTSAITHATYVIIESQRYDYIIDELDEEDEVETIPGLRLVKSHITHMSYDDIDIPGECIAEYAEECMMDEIKIVIDKTIMERHTITVILEDETKIDDLLFDVAGLADDVKDIEAYKRALEEKGLKVVGHEKPEEDSHWLEFMSLD